VSHAISLVGVMLSARMRFSIYGRYLPACSMEGICVC
jgi:hypothetical protein